MDAYMYQAALLCEDCGEKVRKELTRQGKAPEDPDNEHTYDSDDFPKGPYPDGGGEADSPQHCDECNEFLENPLTSDGYKYVEETVKGDLRAGRRNSVAVKEWAPFYDIDTDGENESIREASSEDSLPGYDSEDFYDSDEKVQCTKCGAPMTPGYEHPAVCAACKSKKESIREASAFDDPERIPQNGLIAGTEDWSVKDRREAYDAYVGNGKYASMSREEREAAMKELRKKNESIREGFGDVDDDEEFDQTHLTNLCRNCYEKPRMAGSWFCSTCKDLMPVESAPSKSDRKFIKGADTAKKKSDRADAQMNKFKQESVERIVDRLLGS